MGSTKMRKSTNTNIKNKENEESEEKYKVDTDVEMIGDPIPCSSAGKRGTASPG